MAHRSVVPCVLALAALALPATASAAPPVAALQTPSVVEFGDTYTFKTAGSSDPDTDLLRLYEWDFNGDGVGDLSTPKPTVEVVYAQVEEVEDEKTVQYYDHNFAWVYSAHNGLADQAAVQVRVVDQKGEVSPWESNPVTLTHAPTGRFRIVEDRPYASGQTLHFEARDVWDVDGDLVKVEWELDGDSDFTDGPMAVDTSLPALFPLASRAYTDGTRHVAMKLTDDQGGVTTISRPIVIGNPDLAAQLSATGTNPYKLGPIPEEALRTAPPRAAAKPAAARTVRAAAPKVTATVATSTGATTSVHTVPGARATVTAYLAAKAVGRGTAVADSRGIARVKIRLTKAGRKAVRKGRKLTLRGTAAGRTLRTSVRVR